MPDDSKPDDILAPAVRNRSTAPGDVPDALKRRYYTDERGGEGIGFYTDARIETPAFRDRGRDLVSSKLDQNAIRDMAAIAEHRGWAMVTARGSAAFRREAWLAGRSLGLEVRGYRPTERDIQELERKSNRRLALSPRCVVWDLGEIEAWLEARRRAPIARSDPPDVRRRRSSPVKGSGRGPRALSPVA